jgi:hypothetical protein
LCTVISLSRLKRPFKSSYDISTTCRADEIGWGYLSTLGVPRVISALCARILLFERKIANSSNSQHGGRVFRNSSLSEKMESFLEPTNSLNSKKIQSSDFICSTSSLKVNDQGPHQIVTKS